MNPYVFIVGCPRSGTTLLRRMIDAHSEIAITRETHWIPRAVERQTGVSPAGKVTPALLPSLLNDPRFTRMGVGRMELERLLAADPPLSYSSFVTEVFDLYARAHGKRLAGDKTPGYVRKLPLLHRLWPRTRFVHLIRDGRDVALSLLDWRGGPVRELAPWREDPVATAALFWEWVVRRGRADGERLGRSLYHEVRYESLVERPAEECAALCDFLGLRYDERMLRFHEGRERRRPFLDAKSAWRPVKSGLRDWRKSLGTDDLRRFEAAAGELLAELGYPRGAQDSAPALDSARRVRESFNQAVDSKERRSGGQFPLRHGDEPPREDRRRSVAGLGNLVRGGRAQRRLRIRGE